jgi:hypothetical protein
MKVKEIGKFCTLKIFVEYIFWVQSLGGAVLSGQSFIIKKKQNVHPF